MADIHLEKKPQAEPATTDESNKGKGWLLLLLAGAAIAAALIAWAVLDDDGEDMEQAAYDDTTEQTAGPAREQLPVAGIVDNPELWNGRSTSGEAPVQSVPTDRGFWIQEDGRRLFVVLDPRNLETPYEVESNNRVMIESAEVRNGDDLDDISGQLSAETRDMATQQRVFLLADGQDVDLLAAR